MGAQVLVAESLDGTTWAQPFAVPRGTGSRVDRPRATVFFEPVHVVRTCHGTASRVASRQPYHLKQVILS